MMRCPVALYASWRSHHRGQCSAENTPSFLHCIKMGTEKPQFLNGILWLSQHFAPQKNPMHRHRVAASQDLGFIGSLRLWLRL